MLLLFDLRPNSHTYFCFCSFPTPFHCHRSDCEDFWSLTQESFSTQSCCLLPVIHPSIWKWICRNVFHSLGRTNFLKTLTDLQHFTKLLKIYSDKKKFSILKHNYRKAKEKKKCLITNFLLGCILFKKKLICDFVLIILLKMIFC